MFNAFLNRALGSVGLMRIDLAAERLVPAGTTWSQILDYASGSGGIDFDQAGLPISRNTAVSYATLNRCVTLISGMVACLVTGGNLGIVDPDGRRRRGRREESLLEVFATSCDRGITSSHSFVEDALADYCLDGNFLAVPAVSNGVVMGFRRMSPWDADRVYSTEGEPVYRMTPADGSYATEWRAARDVIHARWPRLLRHSGGSSTREGFALSPVIALRPALEIGVRGDQYIREWFSNGAQSNLHLDFPTPEGKQPLNKGQREEVLGWVQKFSKSREPLVTFGGKSTKIEDTPQDSEARGLREFQVQEIAKVYGVPAPLLGVDVTEWGQGIEQLAKLFWRFGARQHLERFLAPFQNSLLRPGDRFHIDTTDILRGDSAAIKEMVMALQGDAQRAPIATREELRRIAGLTVDPVGEFMPAPTPGNPPVDTPPRNG